MLWNYALVTEISPFYYYALFRKFRTPLHSEPVTPENKIMILCEGKP